MKFKIQKHTKMVRDEKKEREKEKDGTKIAVMFIDICGRKQSKIRLL